MRESSPPRNRQSGILLQSGGQENDRISIQGLQPATPPTSSDQQRHGGQHHGSAHGGYNGAYRGNSQGQGQSLHYEIGAFGSTVQPTPYAIKGLPASQSSRAVDSTAHEGTSMSSDRLLPRTPPQSPPAVNQIYMPRPNSIPYALRTQDFSLLRQTPEALARFERLELESVQTESESELDDAGYDLSTAALSHSKSIKTRYGYTPSEFDYQFFINRPYSNHSGNHGGHRFRFGTVEGLNALAGRGNDASSLLSEVGHRHRIENMNSTPTNLRSDHREDHTGMTRPLPTATPDPTPLSSSCNFEDFTKLDHVLLPKCVQQLLALLAHPVVVSPLDYGLASWHSSPLGTAIFCISTQDGSPYRRNYFMFPLWRREPFTILSWGEKSFDFEINTIPITASRGRKPIYEYSVAGSTRVNGHEEKILHFEAWLRSTENEPSWDELMANIKIQLGRMPLPEESWKGLKNGWQKIRKVLSFSH